MALRSSLFALAVLVVLGVLAVPAVLPAQPAPLPGRPIEVEVGTSANQRGGLLDLLLAASDDDAEAVERELRGSLDDRPWLRVVSSEGEAAVAVNRCRRTISSRRRSRDGKETSFTFRYAVSAAIAIRGERGSIEAETLVTRSYSASSGRQSPTAREDRDAYRRTGDELARKAREWLLPRIAALRPDGPDAGFTHRTRFRMLLKGDGLEVTGLTPGSAADRAGLRVGDRIRRIDREGGTVQMDERVRTWRLEAEGTQVALEVERDHERTTMVVELERPGARNVKGPGPRDPRAR